MAILMQDLEVVQDKYYQVLEDATHNQPSRISRKSSKLQNSNIGARD